jgi:hypothetical protein
MKWQSMQFRKEIEEKDKTKQEMEKIEVIEHRLE